MNRLPLAKRVQIIGMLVEGRSLGPQAAWPMSPSTRLLSCSLMLPARRLHTTMSTSAMCVSGACSAMKFGASLGRRKRTSRQSRKRTDGATFGRGRRSMPTRSCVSRTTWEIAASIGIQLYGGFSNRMWAVRRSPRTAHAISAGRRRCFWDGSGLRAAYKIYGAPTPDERATARQRASAANENRDWRSRSEACQTSYVERQNLTMRMSYSSIYSLDERFSEEIRESRPHGCALLHILQLLPRPSNSARHACNGSWD